MLMELDYIAIGKRIKINRIKLGVTQEYIADTIDITPSHMSNIETGHTKVSLPTLVAIANALRVNIDALLCDSIIASKDILEGEAKAVFKDCNSYEVRVLVDVLKATKDTIRKNKSFNDDLNYRT